jgi:TolB protein
MQVAEQVERARHFTGGRSSVVRSGVLTAVALVVLSGCAGVSERAASSDPRSWDLVFSSNRSGVSQIYLLAAGGDQWRRLAPSETARNWPRFSPDGGQIAFQDWSAGNIDVWLMDADGSDPRALTSDAAHDYLPAWMSSGEAVSFASWRRESGQAFDAVHLYLMQVDGSGQRRLLAEPLGTSSGADFSPDGRQMVFSRAGAQGSALWLAAVDGSDARLLLDDGASNGAARFSPDGEWIAFHAGRGEAASLALIRADGSGQRTLVEGGEAWYPNWSPDGRWLVYTTRAASGEDGDYDLWALEVGDPQRRIPLVTGPGREAEGQWRPR